MKKILLFIPCYNCEKQIVRVLKQIDGQIVPYITEVIVINNRSTDNTEKSVLEFIEKNKEVPIKLLRNKENYNLGGSHKVAFNYAIDNGFDYVIVLHGDDQGSVTDILPILESKKYVDYDCCLGARFMFRSKLMGYSKFRTFGNYVYNAMFSIATFSVVRDLGSGLNMYSVDMLKNKFYLKFSDSLMFNCYMLLANAGYRFNVYFFPISWREDDQVSNVRLLSQAVKTIKIATGYFFSNGKVFLNKDFRDEIISNYEADEIIGG